MSDQNAYESDMGWLSKLNDEEIEQVLAGDYAGNDASLADLAAFARAAQTTFAAPDDATRAAHLTAMAEAAADLDASPARTSKPAASSPIRRVKLVLSSLFASLVAKIALAGVALAATTGGLAVAGSLPEPAQEALATAAEKVGFELPAGDDAQEGEDEAGVPEELPEGTEGSSAPSVLDVIRSWGDDKGCEFGHAVATAAGGNPGPCQDEQGGDGEGAGNGKGRPEGAGNDRPEGAGKPEGTPQGKPAGAGENQGKPEGTPDSQPEGAGKPEGTPEGGNPGTGGTESGDSSTGSGTGGGKPSSVPDGKP